MSLGQLAAHGGDVRGQDDQHLGTGVEERVDAPHPAVIDPSWLYSNPLRH